MTSPLPLEQRLLADAEYHLNHFALSNGAKKANEKRMQVIEAAAARLAGFNLLDYHRVFEIETIAPWAKLDDAARRIISLIGATPIQPTLALAALARERLSTHEQRKAGAHYTDFRLATFLGRKAAALNVDRRPIIDPASGSGILLAATVLAMCGSDRKETAKLLADGVVAADLSAKALRGARLVLASLCNDLGAVRSMTKAWHAGDSLMRRRDEWRAACPGGYGVAVGNPPWEKLKLHRHEEALAQGVDRHYGAAHVDDGFPDFIDRRESLRKYAKSVAELMDATGSEIDLFAGFTDLMMDLSQDGGFAALLPAGLIRSRGTEGLRRRLLDKYQDVGITIFDNKARFFAIDTRFKFLAITGDGATRKKRQNKIAIEHGTACEDRCEVSDRADVPLGTLRSLRPDLTIPEVRDAREWRLYLNMTRRGLAWKAPSDAWYPQFCREVDMTRERRLFLVRPVAGAMPLVEGRMIHQHRFGVKAYQGGSGRKAIWDTVPIGKAVIHPQFWILPNCIPTASLERSQKPRAAFCDIAGQTNERSMLAAVIPAGVSCGNKVPTVLFPNAGDCDALHLWCGMVNSFAFDWLLRRVLTTTVNYFLLQSVPLPPIIPGSLPGRRIVEAARLIARLDGSGQPGAASAIAEARREIDLICLRAYGVDGDDLRVILDDFPSIDRSQPPIAGERSSTVTRDFLLSSFPGGNREVSTARYAAAIGYGATAYVPSQVDCDPNFSSMPKAGRS